MNGGMFKEYYRGGRHYNAPNGLFIGEENKFVGLNIKEISFEEGGNFYLMPNGVFLIENNNTPKVITTEQFKKNYGVHPRIEHYPQIRLATQSGPMLLVDGKINNKFGLQSPNKYVRNGVGILPDKKVVFVKSVQRVNFHTFAELFKSFGCKNALYLDGNLSEMYVPDSRALNLAKGKNFGPIISIVESK